MDRERQLDEVDWKILKAKHATPCCQQSVRVKTVEPGPQVRKCDLCKAHNWFVLEPTVMFPDKLKLRWLTDDEVERMMEADMEGIADGLDVRDL